MSETCLVGVKNSQMRNAGHNIPLAWCPAPLLSAFAYLYKDRATRATNGDPCSMLSSALVCLLLCYALVFSAAEDDVTSVYNETSTEVDISVVVKVPAGSKTTPRKFIETKVSHFFWLYGQAFNLVIGVPGNLLSLMVLRRRKLSQSTSSLYLQILSVTDLFRVIIGVPGRHLVREVTGQDPLSISWWYCVLWYYLLKLTTAYNHWIMAGVSMERCIAIMFPLKSKRIINKKNAKRFLGTTLLCVCIYTLHFFKTYTLVDRFGKKVCTENTSDFFSREVRVWLDYVMIQILPGFFIFLCNGFLIHTLLRRKSGVAKDSSRKTKDPLQAIVRMLVVVSLMYLVLTTPANINYILNSAFQVVYDQRSQEAATEKMTWAIVSFCVFFDHSCNFILYVATGMKTWTNGYKCDKRFRTRAKREMCCCASSHLYRSEPNLPQHTAEWCYMLVAYHNYDH
ncbi:hypothetical protein CAPTEDRAFT_212699 [Capitella teleta]|uniref:G-protein coupled receptors family 1 profile domain-containing protein n=1 Tax=Capitella teleta TaxID=283909 RepID=R7UHU7_CAPTE|nr:hypothetical protein CAPTEDRAFT_212699 [Capitella teleta]|eukprot:ELU06104.1 hypothetical protein CAPTEDRAFT_212699 [Capitella teleta]